MDILYEPLTLNASWIPLVLVFILAVLVVIKNVFSYQFEQQYQLVFKNILNPNLKIDYHLVVNFYNALFLIIQSLVLSFLLTLFIIKKTSSSIENEVFLFIKTSAFIFIFFTIKYLLNLIFISLFKLNVLMHKVIYIKTAYLNFLSIYILIWLPFVLFNFSNSYFLFYISTISSLILALYFYYTLLKLNLKTIFKYNFYFILYLCTLEIAPLIILYRVFISKV